MTDACKHPFDAGPDAHACRGANGAAAADGASSARALLSTMTHLPVARPSGHKHVAGGAVSDSSGGAGPRLVVGRQRICYAAIAAASSVSAVPAVLVRPALLVPFMTLLYMPALACPLAAAAGSAGGRGAGTALLPGTAAERGAALSALFALCALLPVPRGVPGASSGYSSLKNGGCVLCIVIHDAQTTEACWDSSITGRTFGDWQT